MGVVRKPSQQFGSGREAIPDVREWSGGPPEIRECLPITPGSPEAIPVAREWSRVPPGCPEEVARPSRMFRSGRDAIPDVRELLVDPPGCPETLPEDRRHFRMYGSGQEALAALREW